MAVSALELIENAFAAAIAADDEEKAAAIRAECAAELAQKLAEDAAADAAVLAEKDQQISQQAEVITAQANDLAEKDEEIAQLRNRADADAEALAARDAEIIELKARIAELEGEEPTPEPEPEPTPEPEPEPEPTPAPSEWPGPTNTGYKNHPEYPGSLTPWSGGNVQAGRTYRFIDFAGCTISVANVTFIGCRFASSWTDGWNVRTQNDANNTVFSYCTFEPTGYDGAPFGEWPSGGLNRDIHGSTGGGFEPYMIPHDDAYQYGIFNWRGGFVFDHCDMWGFGNAMPLFGSWQKTITNSWIHDAGAEGTGSGMFHTDGPGHLDGGSCSNVLIEGCTIASLGNTNGIAFQAGTYNNIKVRRNYLSGFGFCVDMGHNNNNNRDLEFTDNVISTAIGWRWGPIYTDFSSSFSRNNNVWRRNKVLVTPGSPSRRGIPAGADGKFILPSGAVSDIDWAA